MPNFGSYFRGAYDSITDYMPALPFFGSNEDKGDGEDDDESDDSSKDRVPKLKNSLYSKHRKPLNSVLIQEKNKNSWYDKFFYGSDDDDTTTTTTAASLLPVKSTTESGFFSWLGGSSEETTEKPVIQTTPANKST